MLEYIPFFQTKRQQECPFCLTRDVFIRLEATTAHALVYFPCCKKFFFYRKIEKIESESLKAHLENDL